MTLKQEIDKWLKEHPDATPEQAIWEGVDKQDKRIKR